MRSFVTRLLPAFAVIYALLQVIIAAAHPYDNYSFQVLGGLRMLPSFADLRALTSAAVCSDWRLQITNGADMSCDLYGRTGSLGYPPFSVASLAALRATEESTAVLAIATATIFLGLIWRFFLSRKNRSPLAAIMMTIAVIGAPTLLALERMNIDVLIFVCITGISLLVDSSRTRKPRRTSIVIESCLIFSVSASLVSWKIYPIFGLATILALKTPKATGIQRYAWVSLMAGTFFGMGAIIPWLLMEEEIPSPGLGLISHGFIGVEPIERIGSCLVLGLCLWFALRVRNTFAMSWKCWKTKVGIIRAIPSEYIACTATWLACYLLTRSYDYRLIFFYPAIAYACKSSRLSPRLQSMRTLGLTLFGALVLSPLIYFPFENMNLGIADLMQLSSGKGILAFLRLSGWWIARLMDLGGSALMAILITSTMLTQIEHEGSRTMTNLD